MYACTKFKDEHNQSRRLGDMAEKVSGSVVFKGRENFFALLSTSTALKLGVAGNVKTNLIAKICSKSCGGLFTFIPLLSLH